MSDAGRKDFSTSMLIYIFPTTMSSLLTSSTTEAKEQMTPNSAKSTPDKVKETFTDTTDRFSRGAQPDKSKSGPQEAFDKTQRSHDNTAHGGASNSV